MERPAGIESDHEGRLGPSKNLASCSPGSEYGRSSHQPHVQNDTITSSVGNPTTARGFNGRWMEGNARRAVEGRKGHGLPPSTPPPRPPPPSHPARIENPRISTRSAQIRPVLTHSDAMSRRQADSAPTSTESTPGSDQHNHHERVTQVWTLPLPPHSSRNLTFKSNLRVQRLAIGQPRTNPLLDRDRAHLRTLNHCRRLMPARSPPSPDTSPEQTSIVPEESSSSGTPVRPLPIPPILLRIPNPSFTYRSHIPELISNIDRVHVTSAWRVGITAGGCAPWSEKTLHDRTS